MLLKQKQLCQSKENKWNTKASYYKAFQSLIKTIVCGISKNIFGVVDLKETGGSTEEEGRGDDGKDRELENYRIMWLKCKERRCPLLEIVEMLLVPPQCPSYEEEGGGVTWTGGSKPLLFLAILAAPELVSKLPVGKHLKLLDFQLGKVFHKCRCSWRVQFKTCCLLLSIHVFTTELETQCEPCRIPGCAVHYLSNHMRRAQSWTVLSLLIFGAGNLNSRKLNFRAERGGSGNAPEVKHLFLF